MNEVETKPDRRTSAAPVVVGVGASAGGLEAISALLNALPNNAPVGLVVLQHLDPKHSSNLTELLAQKTRLKVVQAADDALVEAGQVHVIPPDADLRMVGGRLRLVPRQPGLHLPIDAFFESLAADRGRGAAGVVLSGTGSDGAKGVRALRAAGAATFAQDGSAQHSGMPEAAAATGCIDQVLAPHDIAAKLVEQTEDALVDLRHDDLALQSVFSLLRRASGIDFSSYKPSTLRRRIQRRAALGHHPTVEQYLATLQSEPSELLALSEDMLIHVTSFFRDPSVFSALSSNVLPRALASKAAGEPFRVWVPGCATGEEVYSLIILLTELFSELGRELPLKVFGTDLSEKAIERGRGGVYPESIEEQVSPQRLQRFFIRTEAGYQIRKDLRDQCVFARQDITRDPPFSNLDLISCRNLMIYLSAGMQRRVIPIFHYALREGGTLLLGASESPGGHAGFEALDSTHRIYRRNAVTARAELTVGEYPRWPTPRPSAHIPPAPVGHLDVQREADRAVLTSYAPPGVVVTDDLVVVQFRGQTGAYLEPAPGTATLDLLRLEREELRVDLRAALEHARTKGGPVRTEVRGLRTPEATRRVSLEVLPLLPPMVPERHFVVLFREQPALPAAERPVLPAASAEASARAVEETLRAELASTRAYLQSVIEQLEAGNEELRAANEKVVSSNEELQSTNEEMQTAREELQATNEELATVNNEMVQRNLEATRVNDDLLNVLHSVGIAILILGRDSHIRRFTPAAARLLNLIATDVGRPITDIKTNLRSPELITLVADVLEHLAPREQTVADVSGRWYQLTVRPYLTTERKVDGTVVTIVDNDQLHRSKTLLAEARDYAESIVDTVRDPLLVLDERRVVRSANRSFYRKFHTTREEIEGRPLEQLGEPRWAPPMLISAMDKLASRASEDARLEDTPSLFAGRSMLVTGRPLLRGGQPPWMLLAFEDLTEQMRSDAAVRRSERALREMLGAASEAILIANGGGIITYANEMAARTFGYQLDELPGLSIEKLVPEDDAHHAEQELLEAQAGGNTPSHGLAAATNREVRARRKDGTRFPAEVGLSVMEGEQGPLVVAFVSDVTARHESEARISAYKKNLQEMAFDAALVEERQRRKLAIDLHDNIGQTLALAQIRLKAAQPFIEGAPAKDLGEGIKLINVAITDTRELTFELSPPVLYDLGLPAAVSWLGEQLEGQHHLHVEVEADQPFEKLEDETAGLLFRAVREMLTNVVKHAKVNEAAVSLHRHDDKLTVVISDEGSGFDPARLKSYEAAKGFGLFSVREQILRLGGIFEANSSPGRGTRITLQIPLKARKQSNP